MCVALLLAAAMGWFMPLDQWKFKPGDDSRWASPRFDDRNWATLSVAAPADANDGDQGISHYAAGWFAHGYRGYTGFAWYRFLLAKIPSDDRSLSLLGPAMVDSAYQVYVNGELLGGIGDFRRPVPVAYGIHPLKFDFSSNGAPILIAVRVWMGRFAAGPGSGGMHVAPMLGNVDGVRAAYRSQWFEKIRAFALEMAQAFFFITLALAALSLAPFDRAKQGLVMLAVALVLTALWRANLALFWLSSAESVQAFVYAHVDLLVPLTLGAWTLAWCLLLQLRESRGIAVAVLAMTILYVVSEILKRPTFDGGFLSAFAPAAAVISKGGRFAFLALMLYIAYRGIHERAEAIWLALPAIALIAIAQFSGELAALGVPTIWFPFGMGVSLTNYAYLFSTPALAVLLWSLSIRHSPLSSNVMASDG